MSEYLENIYVDFASDINEQTKLCQLKGLNFLRRDVFQIIITFKYKGCTCLGIPLHMDLSIREYIRRFWPDYIIHKKYALRQ